MVSLQYDHMGMVVQDACSIVEAKDCALVIGVTYFLSALLRSFYDHNVNDDDLTLTMVIFPNDWMVRFFRSTIAFDDFSMVLRQPDHHH